MNTAFAPTLVLAPAFVQQRVDRRLWWALGASGVIHAVMLASSGWSLPLPAARPSVQVRIQPPSPPPAPVEQALAEPPPAVVKPPPSPRPDRAPPAAAAPLTPLPVPVAPRSTQAPPETSVAAAPTVAAPSAEAPAVALAPPSPPPVASSARRNPRIAETDVVAPREPAAAIGAQALVDPKPRYPRAAERRGEEGTALLRVLVATDGRPLKVTLERSSGFTLLDQAALDTVASQWRFQPAQRAGAAVESEVLQPVTFTLKRD